MKRLLIIAALLFTGSAAHAQTLTSTNMAFSPAQPTAEVGQPFTTTVTVTDPTSGNPATGSVWIDKVTKTSDSTVPFQAGSSPSKTTLSAAGQASLSYALGVAGSYTIDVCYQQVPTSGCIVKTNAYVAVITNPAATPAPTETGSGSDTGSTGSSTGTGVTIPNPIPCADAACVISQVIKYVLGSIALIATGMFIWGGFLMLTAGGNEKRVEQAKETLAWAAIGIVVIILSWSMISYLLSTLTKATHN